jgi:uracil-DNA glycosylase
VSHAPNNNLITASLRAYLQGLQESGVEGIPEAGRDTGSGTRDRGVVSDLSTGRIAPVQAVPPVQSTSTDRHQPDISTPHHESLEKIRKDLGDCQLCKLGKTRKNLVFGVGNHQARILFVGEGPGADEDAQGEPFVGEAGQVLNRIITAMGLSRQDVYICNVVKCRPPGNRDPQTDEIEACSPFLLRQIHSIRPEVIVALGKFATQTLLGIKEPITRLRGKFRDYHGVPLMPTYHPSYLLRNKGDSAPFWEVWDDMVQVLQLLKLPVPEKSRKR